MKIRTLHKCGSRLQSKIYNIINELCNNYVIDFDRSNITANPESFQAIEDSDIIVLRHPVNRLISMYYSSGWTHTTDKYTDKEWKERKRIRKLSLSEFVISYKLHWQKNVYEKLLNMNHPRIIKYENIMDNPKGYMSLILDKINRLDLLDEVYNNLKNEFIFDGKDRSDDIVNKGLITHVRNLDHKEYLSKFNECEIFFIDRVLGDLLERYNNL